MSIEKITYFNKIMKKMQKKLKIVIFQIDKMQKKIALSGKSYFLPSKSFFYFSLGNENKNMIIQIGIAICQKYMVAAITNRSSASAGSIKNKITKTIAGIYILSLVVVIRLLEFRLPSYPLPWFSGSYPKFAVRQVLPVGVATLTA